MPKLNDLQFVEPPIEVAQAQSMDDLPESGTFTAMLQQGTYEFEIPGNVDEAFDIRKKEGQPDTLVAKFDDKHPLKIVGVVSAPDHNRVGEPFLATVSTKAYPRKLGGQDTQVIDFLYLLKRLGYKGAFPQTFQAYAAALIPFAGKRFKSYVRNSWGCNKDRKARFMQYVVDAAGQAVINSTTGQPEIKEVETENLGCGSNYYPDRDVARQPDGKYPEKIQCKKCNAMIRGFGNLELTRET